MSRWREERNARSRARLAKALPDVFPAPILLHALGRPLVPPLPRLAVESYWRAHPLRADRLARALARRSGTPDGWAWRLSAEPEDGLGRSFRMPPAPFREASFAPGPGRCCICGQPVFRFGWHVDLWNDGKANRRATWHACCVAAWKFWIAPSDQGRLLRKVQGRKCPLTGKRLLKTAEVDHRVPLFRVWRQHRDLAWPDLLGFWGLPNLQAINRVAHKEKCASEASDRVAFRSSANVGSDESAPAYRQQSHFEASPAKVAMAEG